MSGNYGWGGGDRNRDFDPPPRRDTGYSDDFGRAQRAYQNRPSNTYTPPPDPAPSRMSHQVSAGANVDLSARKRQATKAKNVIILTQDTSGSVGPWREEIFKRLALLHGEARKLLGDSVEILLIGVGDVRKCNDPFEVAPLGDGPVLDRYINALTHESAGGGNDMESTELPAVYVDQMVDTSTAQRVFYFTITDEGFYPTVATDEVERHLGITLSGTLESALIFRRLTQRMEVIAVLAETTTFRDNPAIEAQWRETLGADGLTRLSDGRRIVDVIIGAIAKVTGQYEQFSQALNTRQGGTRYGQENIANVHSALSALRGAPSKPAARGRGTRALDPDGLIGVALQPTPSTVDPGSTRQGGTRSLLDPSRKS